MNFDQDLQHQDDELMKLWQGNALPGRMDARQLADGIANKVGKFDRMIWWRNLREYSVGAVLIGIFLWRAFNPATRFIALAGIVAVGFVMFYLWRSHRQTPPPLDPAADGLAYQAALLRRYDHQIRLLSAVKYWYVLPLYLWMLLKIFVTIPSKETGERIVNLVFVQHPNL